MTLATRRRPDRRPAGADGDRRRVPRPRARCASATRAATARRAAARSSRTRSSTSAAAGTSWRGTAGARTGARSASTASTRPTPGARFKPRELPAKDGAAYVSQSLSARPNRYEARLTLHASAEEMRKRMPRYWRPVRAARRRPLRVPHRRRQPRVARRADHDARRRLRGPRAARARRAPRRAGAAPRSPRAAEPALAGGAFERQRRLGRRWVRSAAAATPARGRGSSRPRSCANNSALNIRHTRAAAISPTADPVTATLRPTPAPLTLPAQGSGNG